MIQSTTLTQKWQMTLPKQIRLALGIKKPGSLLVELVDKKKKIIRVQVKPSFLDLAGSIPVKNKEGKKLDIDRVRNYIEKHYERV